MQIVLKPLRRPRLSGELYWGKCRAGSRTSIRWGGISGSQSSWGSFDIPPGRVSVPSRGEIESASIFGDSVPRWIRGVSGGGSWGKWWAFRVQTLWYSNQLPQRLWKYFEVCLEFCESYPSSVVDYLLLAIGGSEPVTRALTLEVHVCALGLTLFPSESKFGELEFLGAKKSLEAIYITAEFFLTERLICLPEDVVRIMLGKVWSQEPQLGKVEALPVADKAERMTAELSFQSLTPSEMTSRYDVEQLTWQIKELRGKISRIHFDSNDKDDDVLSERDGLLNRLEGTARPLLGALNLIRTENEQL